MIRFTASETNKVLREATATGRFKSEKEKGILRKGGASLRKYATMSGSSASLYTLKRRVGKALVAGGAVSRWKFNKVLRRNLKEKIAKAFETTRGASPEKRRELFAEKKEEQEQEEEENKRVKFRQAYAKRAAIDANIKAYMLDKANDDRKRQEQASMEKKRSQGQQFDTPQAETVSDPLGPDD